MREDMFKVIVERPRNVYSNTYSGDGRIFRNAEDAPLRMGMRRGYHRWRKHLNENLAPLKRYLERQVGRPWSDVYSEICAVIDTRSTVKQHVRQHIGDFVALRTRWEASAKGGRVLVHVERGLLESGLRPLHDVRQRLYVHPLTGVLLANPWPKRTYETQGAVARRQEKARAESRRIISADTQWHRLDGLWFEVKLAHLPERADGEDTGCWDVVRKRVVRTQGWKYWPEKDGTQDWYGAPDVYAVSKRQLSAREFSAHSSDTRKGRKAAKNNGPHGPLFFATCWRRAPLRHVRCSQLSGRIPPPYTRNLSFYAVVQACTSLDQQ